MPATNTNKHQDVIRIIASSTKSFDDAVQAGVLQLSEQPHHENLRFTKFEVVNFKGLIEHTDAKSEVTLFEVVMDIAGEHQSSSQPV